MILTVLAWLVGAAGGSEAAPGGDPVAAAPEDSTSRRIAAVPATSPADSAVRRIGAVPVGPWVPPAPARPAVKPAPSDSSRLRVSAKGTDSTYAPVGQGPWYTRPKYIMLRSVVVPGWGQWANHRHVKALVVAAGEGYLIYKAFDWGHVEHNYNVLAGENAGNLAVQYFYQSEAQDAASHRRDFTWWTIFAGVLSMGDAYVDAQLGRHFDAQFKPQNQSGLTGSHGSSPEFQACLAWKLP